MTRRTGLQPRISPYRPTLSSRRQNPNLALIRHLPRPKAALCPIRSRRFRIGHQRVPHCPISMNHLQESPAILLHDFSVANSPCHSPAQEILELLAGKPSFSTANPSIQLSVVMTWRRPCSLNNLCGNAILVHLLRRTLQDHRGPPQAGPFW